MNDNLPPAAIEGIPEVQDGNSIRSPSWRDGKGEERNNKSESSRVKFVLKVDSFPVGLDRDDPVLGIGITILSEYLQLHYRIVGAVEHNRY